MTDATERITGRMLRAGFSPETAASARRTLALGEALRRDVLEISPAARAAYQRAQSAALSHRLQEQLRERERRRAGRRLCWTAGTFAASALAAAFFAGKGWHLPMVGSFLTCVGAAVALMRTR